MCTLLRWRQAVAVHAPFARAAVCKIRGAAVHRGQRSEATRTERHMFELLLALQALNQSGVRVLLSHNAAAPRAALRVSPEAVCSSGDVHLNGFAAAVTSTAAEVDHALPEASRAARLMRARCAVLLVPRRQRHACWLLWHAWLVIG